MVNFFKSKRKKILFTTMTEMIEISKGSEAPEALPESLDLHAETPTQIGVIKDYYSVFTPINSIDGSNTIDFKIPSSLNTVIDPSKTLMRFKFKILKGNETVCERQHKPKLPDGSEGPVTARLDHMVIPVNNIVQSMWSNVMVKINNQMLSTGDSAYPYRADIETKMMTDEQGKKNLLPGGWLEERVPWENKQGSKVDTTAANPHLLVNPTNAFQYRYDRIHHKDENSERGVWFVQGPIHSEIFESKKVLPPGTLLNVIFTKNDPKFCLLSDEAVNYKIQIEDFELVVHLMEVDPDIVNEMLLHTQRKAFVYPMRKVDLRWITIGKERNSINEVNLLPEKAKLPRRLFICFVDQDAFNQPGSLSKDPFHYYHLDMTESTLRVGNTARPYPTIHYYWPQIPEHMFALQHATGTLFAENFLGYYPWDIQARNFVIPYKLAPTESKPGECYEMLPAENVHFNAALGKPTDKVYQMIIYAEYDAELTIDEHGKIAVTT